MSPRIIRPGAPIAFKAERRKLHCTNCRGARWHVPSNNVVLWKCETCDGCLRTLLHDHEQMVRFSKGESRGGAASVIHKPTGLWGLDI